MRSRVATGMLILTMSVAGAANNAECQQSRANPRTQISEVKPASATKSILKAAVPTRIRSIKRTHSFQIGQASWYGPHFQGKKTANGEAFDMNSLTCAHRSLPLGSWVRVTNLKNRKTIFVRVNDRGPVPENRVVDLSYAAARAVGLAGIGKVKLEAVRGGDPEMARDLVAHLHIPLMPLIGQ
jgi:rare lipoprotein A